MHKLKKRAAILKKSTSTMIPPDLAEKVEQARKQKETKRIDTGATCQKD